jgi:hypothetical protein
LLALIATITGYWVVVQPVTRDPLANDFTLAFIAARIGVEHGWDRIYSLTLQHQLFTQLRPDAVFNDGQRFLAPPPLAWITLPLLSLGAEGAFYVWLAISVAALAAAWWLGAPGQGLERWLWLLGAVAWYPALYALEYGQPAPFILLAVIACWKLDERRMPFAAGAALAAGTSLKPQLVLAVPLMLLLAGRWRIFVGWAVAIGMLAAASLLVIGGNGLRDYQSLLAEAQTLVNNRYFTLAYLVGPGPLSYVAQFVVLMAAAAGAFLNRTGSTARLVALGLVAGALSATYWHLQDFTILLGAAWLFWRDQPPLFQRAWLALVAVSIELAWPLTPLPLLIAVAVWLVFMCVPQRAAQVSPATA